MDFKETVYFYCFPQGPPENAAYQHFIVCFAEGLSELEVSTFSNLNYWRVSPHTDEYLLKHDPDVESDDCSVVVVSSGLLRHNAGLPPGLFHRGRKYITVYLDEEDIVAPWLNEELTKFDFVFKAHSHDGCPYPSNFSPIAFGLSQRILRELKSVPHWDQRRRTIVQNFRCKHDLRHVVKETFNPLISKIFSIDDAIDELERRPDDAYNALMWAQSGRRHYPAYYERLRSSMACSAFGGKWSGGSGTPALIQWDSWRLWESLAAGCVTFHVDFEKYGFRLPVRPTHWQHYIGIDLSDIEAAVERLLDEPSVLPEISSAGRRWAIDHYSPAPVARRILTTILGGGSGHVCRQAGFLSSDIANP